MPAIHHNLICVRTQLFHDFKLDITENILNAKFQSYTIIKYIHFQIFVKTFKQKF